jgi:hypothetical protein
MRFCQAKIARTAQASGANRLGNRAFHTRASGIRLLELFGRLPLASGLEGIVLVAGANRERPRLRSRLGTVGACRTGVAIRPCEPNMDDGMPVAVVPRDL